MLNIGPQELILILIVALVVVGPQRLPELGRTIGKALREFRKIQDDVRDTIRFDLDDEPETYVRPRPGPRSPGHDGNGGVSTATDVPLPTEEMPDVAGSVTPDTVGEPAADAPPEAEIDPEPRAVE
jgi:sec-independent protein translocase protein TatB